MLSYVNPIRNACPWAVSVKRIYLNYRLIAILRHLFVLAAFMAYFW
jgi:hypothetical protein